MEGTCAGLSASAAANRLARCAQERSCLGLFHRRNMHALTRRDREKAVLAVEEDEDEVEEPFFSRFSNSLPPHLARCTIALALRELWSNANGPTNLDGRGNLPT